MSPQRKWSFLAGLAVLGCSGAAAVYYAQRHHRPEGTAAAFAESCIQDLALGTDAMCVLFKNGRVHCFGKLALLGKPFNYSDPDPDRGTVQTEVRFSHLAVGHDDACGLDRRDGSVWCWGESVRRRFGHGEWSFPTRYDSLGAGNRTLTLAADRVCVVTANHVAACQGLTSGPAERVLEGVIDVAGGNYFACARMRSGGVQCWGSNGEGELGRGTTSAASLGTWSDPPAPVVGLGHTPERIETIGATTCSVSNGQLWCWGSADDSFFADGRDWDEKSAEPYPIEAKPVRLGVPPFKEVARNGGLCLIHEDGSVWCWGPAAYNEMLDGRKKPYEPGFPSVQPRPRKLPQLGNDNFRIYGGNGHYCVWKTDASVWCWGDNTSGQIQRGRADDDVVPLTRKDIECPP